MGLGRGCACIGIQLNYSERGWGRVGHALGFNKITLRLRITLRLGPGYKDRPSQAACGADSGRVGPSRAEWGRVGPVRAEWGWGGVGHALGLI